MPSAWEKIATATATGSETSLTFSSISGSYTDLMIKVVARSQRSATTDSLMVRLNGISSSNSYRYTLGSSNGSTHTSSVATTTFLDIGATIPAANATTDAYGVSTIYIPKYTASTHRKVVNSFSAFPNDTSLGYLAFMGGELIATTSDIAPVTSIEILSFNVTNLVAGSYAVLYGLTKGGTTAGSGSKATGGVVTTSGGYTYHTFLNSGTFVANQSLTADYLVIGGGGGGGYDTGGGGGAGGVRSTITATGGGGTLPSALSLSAGSYTVIVGGGGAGATNSSVVGGDGGYSRFNTVLSTGGGGGGTNSLSSGAGLAGGSGGGGAAYSTTNGAAGAGTANEGNNGGIGSYSAGGGGGGGGAGAVGQGGGATMAGQGGNGLALDTWGNATGTGYPFSTERWFAGGGGGGRSSSNQGGQAHLGGGGNGGFGTISMAEHAVKNTGGGGGGGTADGASANRRGGSGASGLVIIRYST